MKKIYTALGLMSGTSLDGLDISIIKSDGIKEYLSIFDRYFEYDNQIIEKLLKIRGKLSSFQDLKSNEKEIINLEKEITLFHARAVEIVLKEFKSSIDLIGFHGQTIFHEPKMKITKQLGDGKLLSQLTKKKVVYNFRENDLTNGGQGAPLTPIFHNILANKINEKFNLGFPIYILNIGGISNITITADKNNLWNKDKIYAYDIGPGNCLIDDWIRNNSKKKFDKGGSIAKSGKLDKLILNQALENFSTVDNYEKSLDVKDFDIFFAKGLSLEDGTKTITEFTAKLISNGINYINSLDQSFSNNWLVCGGGRKNEYLLERIRKNHKEINLVPIEKYGINGDFIESQAFAFLAIRSLKGKPISFPTTTRCKQPLTGGVIVENF